MVAEEAHKSSSSYLLGIRRFCFRSVMKPEGRIWLLLGASVSFFVAILHVISVIIGPAAYSFFGGERLARLAAGGFAAPAVMTLLLAAVHALFGTYALSVAGVIRRLPLLVAALLAIGGIYGFRGLSAIEQAIQILQDPQSLPFRILFYSLVSLVTGCAYIVGAVKRLQGEGEI